MARRERQLISSGMVIGELSQAGGAVGIEISSWTIGTVQDSARIQFSTEILDDVIRVLTQLKDRHDTLVAKQRAESESDEVGG